MILLASIETSQRLCSLLRGCRFEMPFLCAAALRCRAAAEHGRVTCLHDCAGASHLPRRFAWRSKLVRWDGCRQVQWLALAVLFIRCSCWLAPLA